MSLGSFIAGPYSSTYDSTDLGIMQDGYEVRLRPSIDLVDQSDIYGDSVIDGVYRGGNCLISMVGLEFTQLLAKSALWPYGALNTSSLPALGFMGSIGTMLVGSNKSKSTVLTALTGRTASAAPATMTATQAVMADGSETAYLMTSRNRTSPLVLRCLPYDVTNPSGMPSGTYEVWFTNA